jgi:hypothetical protein
MPATGNSARTREGHYTMVLLTLRVIEDLIAIRFLAKEEDIIGPYRFGVYDVLVLPPSFPYGGMVSRAFPSPSSPKAFIDGERRKMPVFPS